MIARTHKSVGFTLIEVVVALAVFGIVGITAFSGLNAILKWQTDLELRSDQIKSIQLTLKYLERDINRSIARPIRDQYGDTQPAFSSDGESIMSLTYSGWRNPAGLLRSSLQRVAYEVNENQFKRHSWNRLDGAISEDAREVVLLEEVKELEIEFLNQANAWVDQWPPLNSDSTSIGLPRAVLISFEAQPIGKITRIITVPE
ncbi:MAG: type II secretion system minor pseudopilin GspJ [Gammaproteobacteria bacterium]|nr:type II secretion system minor pseudopilin GspJ [Gammaproteobacteria bacterium]